MGASRPWPDVLEVIAGQRELDATSILDYFAPLKVWLAKRTRATPAAGSRRGVRDSGLAGDSVGRGSGFGVRLV